jgi:hypothetical protein
MGAQAPRRLIEQIAVSGQGIDQSPLQGQIGWDDLGLQQHPQRRLDADQPRQTLRSAGAWVDPQRDLRHAESCVLHGHSPMTRQCQLQRTADHRACQRRRHRLAGILDALKGFLKSL